MDESERYDGQELFIAKGPKGFAVVLADDLLEAADTVQDTLGLPVEVEQSDVVSGVVISHTWSENESSR